MAKLPSIEEMVKDVKQRVLQEITINDMPLSEFVEKVNSADENNDCNLTTCRYNKDGKCTNEEKRKECIRVSKSVLCIDGKSINDFYARMYFETMTQWKDGLTDTCDTNQNCENDPKNCGYAVEYSTLEDAVNGIHKYMCGRGKCKYFK